MLVKPGNPWGRIRGKVSLNPEQALRMFGFTMDPSAPGVIFRQYVYYDDNNHPHTGTFISNYFPATNPRTAKQQANRGRMRDAVTDWHTLSEEEKEEWDRKARKKPLSGFNLHNREYLISEAEMTRFAENDKVENCLLVWKRIHITAKDVEITFPYTPPGLTPWANVIITLDTPGNGGQLKSGQSVTANTWYYVFISNTYTLSQPLLIEFLFSTATTEAGYTRIGCVRNTADTDAVILRYVNPSPKRYLWNNPDDHQVLSSGTATVWTEVDCNAFVPGTIATSIKMNGRDHSSGAAWTYVRGAELDDGNGQIITMVHTAAHTYDQGKAEIGIAGSDGKIDYKCTSADTDMYLFVAGFTIK